jgi:hypothetical protein
MNKPLLPLIFVSLLTLISNVAWAQMTAAPAIPGIKGKLEAVTTNSLKILTNSEVVSVRIKQPLITYGRIPSDLSHVTSASFVGVTSVKEANGTQLAKEIHIFPPELRGAGEGSNPLSAALGVGHHSRMTNGSVSQSFALPRSRMTNGEAQVQGGGTILRVQYQGGEQTIVVPHDVPVTQIVPMKENLQPGDTVYVETEKLANGTLTTNRVYLIAGAGDST